MDRQVMNRWTKRGMTGDGPGLSALWEAPFAVGTAPYCEHHPLHVPAFSQLATSVWTTREEGLGGSLAESYQGGLSQCSLLGALSSSPTPFHLLNW